MRGLMAAAAVLVAISLPVQAQTRLPRTSPAERQVQELNRSIQREGSSMQRDQQIQMDNNRMRQRIDRQQNLSNPSPPARSGIGRCPAGSVGC